jgi:membrane protein implicated in regulation of membrane protease activity
MLIAAASKPFIDWNALGKICLAALIGGTGVVIAFGILLIALKRARLSDDNAPVRLGSWALAIVCGAFVIGAVVIGITAVIDKPASQAKKAHKSTAALTAPGHRSRLVA